MDAKSLRLGAVLCQVQGSRKHVIAYASRRLKSAERNNRNYSNMKWEPLSNGLSGKCKKYLLGCKFTVQTEHHPLLHLLGDEEEFDGCISICNLINWATALVPEIVSAGLKCCQVRQTHVMATEQVTLETPRAIHPLWQVMLSKSCTVQAVLSPKEKAYPSPEKRFG